MNELRIVFMGTPEFAVGILDSILIHKYKVVGVITAPDKPAGRGQQIKYSAVKEYAVEKGLTLLQPSNLKDPGFLEQLRLLQANLQVVVAFRMLPEAVWKMPEYGTFNLHASLLPDYRGAAPINWAIINGDTKTGVTTFFIDDKIDTGAIILSREAEISPDENAGQLHDKLMNLGREAVIDTLKLIERHEATPKEQDERDNYRTASKLNKENCRIDWTINGRAIYNVIRGLSPYPAAWCIFYDMDKSWNVKIYDAEFHQEPNDEEAGTMTVDKKSLKIAVTDGYLDIKELQFPGKKKMKVSELLNGMTFTAKAHAG
ncbi:MAG TPA: methionyl-tRNA formyltransferase [Flavobacterium sp.]|jgi:methionyl-tRNA formyltransferase